MKDIEMKRENAELRVTLGTKLTAIETPELQTLLKEKIAGGIRSLIFDLKKTATLDSTGIGLLVAANNSLIGVQGQIKLVHVSADILRLLKSMRLADRLHATAEEGRFGGGEGGGMGG